MKVNFLALVLAVILLVNFANCLVLTTQETVKTVYLVYIPELARYSFIPNPSKIISTLSELLSGKFEVIVINTEEKFRELLFSNITNSYIVLLHGEYIPLLSDFNDEWYTQIEVLSRLTKRENVYIHAGGHPFYHFENKKKNLRITVKHLGLDYFFLLIEKKANARSATIVSKAIEGYLTPLGERVSKIFNISVPNEFIAKRQASLSVIPKYVFYESNIEGPYGYYYAVATYQFGKGFYIHIGYSGDSELSIEDLVKIALIAVLGTLYEESKLSNYKFLILADERINYTVIDRDKVCELLTEWLHHLNLSYVVLRSVEDFRLYLVNETENVVIFNCHGEILPIPRKYGVGKHLLYLRNITRLIRDKGWIWVHLAGYPFYYVAIENFVGRLCESGSLRFFSYLGCNAHFYSERNYVRFEPNAYATTLVYELEELLNIDLPDYIKSPNAIRSNALLLWSLYKTYVKGRCFESVAAYKYGNGTYVHIGIGTGNPTLMANLIYACIMYHEMGKFRPIEKLPIVRFILKTDYLEKFANLTVKLTDMKGNVLYESTFNRNGIALFYNITPDVYALYIGNNCIRSIDVFDCDNVVIPIRKLHVKVEGFSNGTISIINPLTDEIVAKVNTTSHTFLLPSRTYLIRFTNGVSKGEVYVELSKDLEIKLKPKKPPIKLTLAVYNPISWDRVRNAEVIVWSLDKVYTARTNKSGMATISLDKADLYHIVVRYLNRAFYTVLEVFNDTLVRVVLAEVSVPKPLKVKFRIIDSVTNETIKNVRLKIRPIYGVKYWVYEKFTGDFEIYLAKGIEYEISISAPNYKEKEFTWHALEEYIEIKLTPTVIPWHEVIFYVRDKDTGLPLPNAIIKIIKDNKTLASLVTDSKGMAKVELKRGTIFSVLVERSNYASQFLKRIVVLRDMTILINLTRIYFNLTLKVVDEKGKPIPNANVTILVNGKLYTSGNTNASGIFQVKVQRGSYRILISAKNFESYNVTINIIKDTYKIVTLRHKPKRIPLAYIIGIIILIILIIALIASLRRRRKVVGLIILMFLVFSIILTPCLVTISNVNNRDIRFRNENPLLEQFIERKLVLAFYYVWYTWPWEGFNDTIVEYGKYWSNSYYYPIIGLYSSNDELVIRYHFKLAKMIGIDGFLVSWWGIKTLSDFNFRLLLKIAKEYDIKLAIYFEGPGFKARAGKSIDKFIKLCVRALSYIYDNYANDDAYLKILGKPVVGIYGAPLVPPEVWKKIFEELRRKGKEFITFGDTFDVKYILSFDGLHKYNIPGYNGTYGLVKAWEIYGGSCNVIRKKDRIFTVTVNPGFNNRKIKPYGGWKIVLRMNGLRYNGMWSIVFVLKPKIVFICTWNEWWESTIIEPSFEHGYFYLELTSSWITLFKKN